MIFHSFLLVYQSVIGINLMIQQTTRSTITRKISPHPSNTLLSGDTGKDCSLLLSNNADIQLRDP